MNQYDQEIGFFPPITADTAPMAPPQLPPSPPPAMTQDPSQGPDPMAVPHHDTGVAPEFLIPGFAPEARLYQALGDGEAVPPPPYENAHMLGLALICTGVGAALGLRYGGIYGSVSGSLYGGAIVNAMRAVLAVTKGTPDNDHEATVSGTYAVLGAGIASYLLWKTRSEHAKKNRSTDNDDRLIGIK